MRCTRTRSFLCIVFVALTTSCGISYWPEYTGPDPVPDQAPRALSEREEKLAGLYDLIDVTIRHDGLTRTEQSLGPWSGTLQLEPDRTGFLTLELEGAEATGVITGWHAYAASLSLGLTYPVPQSAYSTSALWRRSATWQLTPDGVLITAYDLEATDFETYSWQPR